LNHGIDLSADGKTLFASTADVVYSYSYDAATMKAGTPRTIISGMVSLSFFPPTAAKVLLASVWTDFFTLAEL
jgi:hypothetical protein